MKKFFLCACICMLASSQLVCAGYKQTVKISGEMITGKQGENGWTYMMNHNEVFNRMPKFSDTVTPTWRSGYDYPYVDGNYFFPSNSWAAVKKWTAWEECTVTVSGDISVSENSYDGVFAKIKKNSQILWEDKVYNETKSPLLENIDMNIGDSLYFIVDAGENMKGDKTCWNPIITYEKELEKPKIMEFSAKDFSDLTGGAQISDDCVIGFTNSASFALKNVNLFDGYRTLGIKLNAGYTGERIEVRLDSPSGRVVSDVLVCNTDGEEEIQYLQFDGSLEDIHDLYFVAVDCKSIEKIAGVYLLEREPFGAEQGIMTVEAENSYLGSGAQIHNLKNYDVPQTTGDSRDGNNYNRQQKAVQSASGKSYVDLDAVGEYVEFTVPKDSNRMILRYTIPRNSSGSINLYLNNSFNRSIDLTSTYNYDTNNYYMRSFDEKLIEIDLHAGDKVSLQKDSSNTLDYYGIDLADFEMVEQPVPFSEDYISIEEYGAVANDENDDTEAIEAALNVAKLLKTDVYIPQGRFIQTKRVEIPDGVNIIGAGMWYSEIYCPTRSYGNGEWGGKIGYYVKSNTTISNLMISGNSRYRGDSGIAVMGRNYGDGDNCTLDKVWFRNMTTAMGWTNWKNSVIKNCRFTGIYADAIHFGDGAQENNTAYNNFIRGCGDDGIAVVIRSDYTEEKGLKASGFTAQFNTVSAAYWGRDMSIVGGSDVKYTNNLMDGSVNAGLMVSTEYLSPSHSVANEKIRVQRNIIKHTSNRLFHHAGIHIDLSYNPIKDARFECNYISDTASSAVWIDNSGYGDGGTTEFNFNTAVNAGWSPAYQNKNNLFNPVLRENSGF